jgi:hypothetical protein
MDAIRQRRERRHDGDEARPGCTRGHLRDTEDLFGPRPLDGLPGGVDAIRPIALRCAEHRGEVAGGVDDEGEGVGTDDERRRRRRQRSAAGIDDGDAPEVRPGGRGDVTCARCEGRLSAVVRGQRGRCAPGGVRAGFEVAEHGRRAVGLHVRRSLVEGRTEVERRRVDGRSGVRPPVGGRRPAEGAP